MTICCLFSDCRKHPYNKDNDLLAVIYEAEWFSLRKKWRQYYFSFVFYTCGVYGSNLSQLHLQKSKDPLP